MAMMVMVDVNLFRMDNFVAVVATVVLAAMVIIDDNLE